MPFKKSYFFLINNDYKNTALNHKRYAANVFKALSQKIQGQLSGSVQEFLLLKYLFQFCYFFVYFLMFFFNFIVYS